MGGDAGTVTTVRVPVMGKTLELPKYYDVVFLERVSVCPDCKGPVTKVPGVFCRELQHLYGRVTRLTFHQFICRRCKALVISDKVLPALTNTKSRFHADVIRLFWRLRENGLCMLDALRELREKYLINVARETAYKWDKISGSDRLKIAQYTLA